MSCPTVEKILHEISLRIEEANNQLETTDINDSFFDYTEGRVEALESIEAFIISEFC